MRLDATKASASGAQLTGFRSRALRSAAAEGSRHPHAKPLMPRRLPVVLGRWRLVGSGSRRFLFALLRQPSVLKGEGLEKLLEEWASIKKSSEYNQAVEQLKQRTEEQTKQTAVLQNLRMQFNRCCCTACWVDGHSRRNWSCPKCVDEYWNELDQRRSDTAASAATDTAGSAGQLADAAATSFDALKLEVQQLKAEVVELKDEDTKQTTKARLGQTIVVAFTEDEAKEMRDIAEETGRCGQPLVHLAVDICGPCNPWSPTIIADDMKQDGNRIVTLSSRLLQLLRQQPSASSREV